MQTDLDSRSTVSGAEEGERKEAKFLGTLSKIDYFLQKPRGERGLGSRMGQCLCHFSCRFIPVGCNIVLEICSLSVIIQFDFLFSSSLALLMLCWVTVAPEDTSLALGRVSSMLRLTGLGGPGYHGRPERSSGPLGRESGEGQELRPCGICENSLKPSCVLALKSTAA